MKIKTSALICICLGALSFLLAILKSDSWPFIIASLVIGVTTLIFGIIQIVLKEKLNNRVYYYLIILIGVLFLFLGLIK